MQNLLQEAFCFILNSTQNAMKFEQRKKGDLDVLTTYNTGHLRMSWL